MIRFHGRARWLGAALLSLTMLAVAAPSLAQEISPDQLALARKYVDLTDKVDIYGTTVTDTAAQTLQQVLKLNPTLGDQAVAAVTAVVQEYKARRGGRTCSPWSASRRND